MGNVIKVAFDNENIERRVKKAFEETSPKLMEDLLSKLKLFKAEYESYDAWVNTEISEEELQNHHEFDKVKMSAGIKALFEIHEHFDKFVEDIKTKAIAEKDWMKVTTLDVQYTNLYMEELENRYRSENK